ncbi:dihydrofolate reductase family protein [Solicola sp. PLA-1-18]|uniref:dihydrofolate reductase family protein n=1 Tax=Solicola sp. PLA-1-18 TaxID=3380532 RepID=UPI003B7F56EB
MGQVIASATMSLDGFIAHHDHGIDPLFDWYETGDEAVTTASPDVSFSLTATSAAYWRSWVGRLGALVVGRELFDLVDGWGGTHPIGTPVVVLTHQAPTDWSYPGSEDFHFVTDGVEAAVTLARSLAGERDVAVAAGTVARQCLEAGLLDAVAIDLAPVVLGEGRPFFGALAGGAPVRLGDPTTVIEADRVLHLVYPVLREP